MTRRVPFLALAALCGLLIPAAANALQPGSYRCSAYNVSGGGGSCRNYQPLVLNADGSYQFSSTRGEWRAQGGQLLLSEARLWGPGQILGNDAVRFEYDYRGWRHVLTFRCQECGSGAVSRGAADPQPAARGASRVGVSLALEFNESIGGVSGFVIVPAESAQGYSHNAPLPEGAVQGLAYESGASTVKLATNRNNKLQSGRKYVVFLSWPRETLPVAILDLPRTDRDYSTTIPARLR